MEYLLGSFATFIIILICYFILNYINNNIKNNFKKIKYSQSHVHSLIAPFIPILNQTISNKITQSKNHDNKNNIKVIIIDNSAYWIKDNAFYTAFIDPHGTVDKDTTRIVDTMAMDPVELDKMLFIMDKLREGLNNDSGSSGQ